MHWQETRLPAHILSSPNTPLYIQKETFPEPFRTISSFSSIIQTFSRAYKAILNSSSSSGACQRCSRLHECHFAVARPRRSGRRSFSIVPNQVKTACFPVRGQTSNTDVQCMRMILFGISSADVTKEAKASGADCVSQ